MGNRNDDDRDGWNSHDDHHSHSWWNPTGIRGTNGNDLLVGTSRNDRIDGRGGDDVIHGKDGNDKIKGSSGDDIIDGGKGNDDIDGGRGNDEIFGGDGNDTLKGGGGEDLLDGGAGNDRLEGGTGDDILSGGTGNDVLVGNGGNDMLFGGAGDDTLYGSDKGSGHFPSWFWWLCKPAGYEDYLDGGAGNDKLYAAGGNDVANYTMAENLGAHDFYDGGKGSDTLQLTLTWGEFALTSVKQDIARFELFLDQKGNPGKDTGPTFQFGSFDLDARNFEDLDVNLANTGPDAVNDAGATNEDTVLSVSALAGLLQNDTDPDHLDVLTVNTFSGTSAMGAAVVVNADGSYSYDPTSSAALEALAKGVKAVDSFTYTIHDLAGATDTATVNITVTGTNDAPEAVNDEYSLNEDTILTISGPGLLGNDFDPDGGTSLTALLVSGPAHGTLLLNADGSFSYTPDANFNGTDGFIYRANDGQDSSQATGVKLNVRAVNDAPVAGDDAYFLDEDTVLALHVLDNDSDVDGDALQTVIYEGPAHGMVTHAADGSFLYTPNADFNGTDSFQYRSNDGNLPSGIATVSITVKPVNDAPDARDDAFVISEDEILQAGAINHPNLLANDSDVDSVTPAPITSVDTSGLLGQFIPAIDFATSGSFTFDPTQTEEFQALQLGESLDTSFTYTVDDGKGGTDTATVTITVEGRNDAPTAGDDAEATNEDTAIGGSVLDNDTDVDSGTLTIAAANVGTFITPNGASFTLNADGSYSYDPRGSAQLQALNQGQSVTESFGYAVNDGHGGTDTATLSITVAGVTDAPPQNSNAVLPSFHESGGLDYYIRFEGINATNEWLNLRSFSLDIENSGSAGSGGGGGAGKVSAEDLFSALGNNATTTTLLQTLASGKQVPAVEIEVYQSNQSGKGQILEEFRFEGVGITSLSTSGIAQAGTSNDVSFGFGSYARQFYITNPDTGKQTGTASTSWDFESNTKNGPAVDNGGDAIGHLPPEAETGDSLEYFVHFDGVPGWLEIESFSMGLGNTFDTGGGGAGGAGKASHGDVVLNVGLSEALLKLNASLFSGKHLTGVEIEVYQGSGGGKPMLVDEYHFSDALLTQLATSNSVGNTLSFDYAQVTHAHVELDKSGTAGAITKAGWDFGSNKSVVPGNPAADADPLPVPSYSNGDGLDYYIRFEGINGTNEWLSLHSFSLDVSNSSGGTGGGGGAGKAAASDLSSALGNGATATELLQNLASGKVLGAVEIEVYTSGSTKGQVLEEYRFEDVVLTGLGTSGVGNGGIGNDLSFDFGSYTRQFTIPDPQTGQPTGTASASWDFIQNTKSGPTIDDGGDAIGHLPAQSETGDSLDFYVRFDGIQGWLQLDSFSMAVGNASGLGGSGGGAGKASNSDVVLDLGSSAALLSLNSSLFSGKHLGEIEIEVYQGGGGGKALLVDEFHFGDVLLTGLATSNAVNNVLSFDYGQVTHAHVEATKSGGAGDVTKAGWDFAANELAVAPDPSADADSSQPLQSYHAESALDYYIRFDGINAGNEWLNLRSFSLGFENAGSSGSAGGAGSGRVSASDVMSALGNGATATALLESLASGKALGAVEIEVYQSGASKGQLLEEFKFDHVGITGLNTSGAGNGGISNDVTFDFGGYTRQFTITNPQTGQQTGTATTSWDFITNTKNGPAIDNGGDAIAHLPAEAESGAPLDYYVRFDGIQGWLQLENFSMGVSNTFGSGGGGGAGAGKASHGDVVLDLGSSAALINLNGSLLSGKHLTGVEIEVYQGSGGGKPMLVDEFHFNDVLLTGLQTSNAVENTLTFDYRQVGHAHVELTKAGGIGDITLAGWDFGGNGTYVPPQPHADVDIV